MKEKTEGKATNSTSERTGIQRRPRNFSPMGMNANAEEMPVRYSVRKCDGASTLM